jgi:hypothetical protein
LVGKEIIGKKGDPFSWCYWAPKNKTVGKAFNSFFQTLAPALNLSRQNG